MLTLLVGLLLAASGREAAAGRTLLQTYPACGGAEQPVTLDATQLAFKNYTKGSLEFDCNALYEGYSRGCVSNSVYTYIIETIASPPYLPNKASPRPYVSAYAKPADAALAVKQELYYLDLQTGTIYVSAPANEVPPGTTYPFYAQYPLAYDAAGLPDNNADVSGQNTGPAAQYAFYLNEIRSAIQNVTNAPHGEAAFACNPTVPKLDPLLQYLYEVQGIAGDASLPLSPPLRTGPLPAGDIPQY